MFFAYLLCVSYVFSAVNIIETIHTVCMCIYSINSPAKNHGAVNLDSEHEPRETGISRSRSDLKVRSPRLTHTKLQSR